MLNFNFKNLFIIVVVFLTTVVIVRYIGFNLYDNNYESKIVVKTIYVILTIILIYKVGFIKYLKPNKYTVIYVIISLFLIITSFFKMSSLAIQNGVNIDTYDNLIFLLSCLLTGLFEELFSRIFIFYFIYKIVQNKKNYLILSIVFSSMLFGFVHITNFFNPDYVKLSVPVQIIFAFAIGLLFQSLYLRFNSLVLIMFLHSIVNYWGAYKTHLFKIESDIESVYTLNDLVSSLIFLTIFILIFIIPVSYILIRKQLNKKRDK